MSSGSKSSAGDSSSDGGDYSDLPIVLESQGEAQIENNDEQGLAKVSPNLANRDIGASNLRVDST